MSEICFWKLEKLLSPMLSLMLRRVLKKAGMKNCESFCWLASYAGYRRDENGAERHSQPARLPEGPIGDEGKR